MSIIKKPAEPPKMVSLEVQIEQAILDTLDRYAGSSRPTPSMSSPRPCDSSSRRITTSSVGSVHETHLTPRPHLAHRRSHDSTHPQFEKLHRVPSRVGNGMTLYSVAVP